MKEKRKKLWWAEIFLQLLLAAGIWGALTWILYGGNKRDSLVGQVEHYLIVNSLRAAAKPALKPGRIQMISLDETDVGALPPAPGHRMRDVDIRVYARLLDRVAVQRPEAIFLSWLPGAHQTDREYLEPIIAAARRAAPYTRLYIPYPYGELAALPKELRQVATVLEADDCGQRVAAFCPWNRLWMDQWVVQTIVDFFWQEPTDIPAFHISKNLPDARPNYLLNLPLTDSLPELRFRQVLQDTRGDRFQGKLIFIGNSLVQDGTGAGKKLLRRLFTATDDSGQPLARAGTPYHVFWARIAQMFEDGSTVGVPPYGVTIILVIFLSLMVIFLLWKVGAAPALGIFLIYSILYPWANDFGVRLFRVYIPMLDLVYSGFLTFLVAAFALLAVRSFRMWRLEARAKSHADTAALKGNFISLISHNLNTPVAKMQGLVDILRNDPKMGSLRPIIDSVRSEVARLQLCVRAVLISTALEDGSLDEKALSLSSLQKEFEQLISPILENFGIRIHLDLPESDAEAMLTPFTMDSRALCFTLGALSALYGYDDDEVSEGNRGPPVNVGLRVAFRDAVDLPDDGYPWYEIRFSFRPEGDEGESGHLNRLFEVQSDPGRKLYGEDFFSDAMINLVHLLKNTYRGRLEQSASVRGDSWVLTICPRGV